MLAYIFGALLHLIEDSTTVRGTQFNYPFSKLILKGKLITRPDSAKKPNMFVSFLGISILALFFGIELEYVTYPDWLITTISIIFLIISWSVFLLFVAKVKLERGELKTYPNVKSFL